VDLDTVHARKAAQRDLERYQEPLFAIAGHIPPVEQWPLRGGDTADGDVREIVGAAGSPGRATGRARVVLNAYVDEPPEPDEVLIAPITDPGWMPLFVGAVTCGRPGGRDGRRAQPHDDRGPRSRPPGRRRSRGSDDGDQDR
jgi:hypothetical protein